MVSQPRAKTNHVAQVYPRSLRGDLRLFVNRWDQNETLNQVLRYTAQELSTTALASV